MNIYTVRICIYAPNMGIMQSYPAHYSAYRSLSAAEQGQEAAIASWVYSDFDWQRVEHDDRPAHYQAVKAGGETICVSIEMLTLED